MLTRCYNTKSEQQAQNKTTSIIVEYYGCKKCLREWCRELKLPYKTIFYRLAYLKWDVKKAFETEIKEKSPTLLRPNYTYKGYSSTCRGICKKFNLDYTVVRRRLLNGWDEVKAFSTKTVKGYSYKNRKSNIGGCKLK